MLTKILVPLDGSRLAEQVLPAVIELAGAFGSEVDIISVCGVGETAEGQTSYFYINEVAATLKRRLGASAAALGMEVLYGKPSEQILQYAKNANNDLIMMSSHGRSGIMPWSLGSTVDKIFNRTSVPLIVVRAKEPVGETRLFRRIILPLDGSEKSVAILPYVKKLAEGLSCEVFLIKVVEAGRHVRTIGGLDYVRFMEQDINSTRGNAKKSLESLGQSLVSNKSKVHCEVRAGEPAAEIPKYADEVGCTLIAMTSHGHHGIEAWSLGSVASKIAAVARQSVFLLPSFVRK